MKHSIIRLYFLDFNKFVNSVIYIKDRRPSLNNFRNEYNKLYYVYKKLVKQDLVNESLNKVNGCHHELSKFRETQVDYISRLTNIRFELNRLGSSIHEAKRLEDDNRYLELTRRERTLENEEKLLRNDFNNAEKREQSLKDALAITREELHIKQRIQGDYGRFLLAIMGVIVTITSFIIYLVRLKNESMTLEALMKEFKDFKQKMEGLNKTSPKFTHYVLKFSGINFVLSCFTNNDSKKTVESDTKSGTRYYLGRYTGINYIYSCFKSTNSPDKSSVSLVPQLAENDHNKQQNQNFGYMHYLGKYTGISYAASFFKSNKSATDAHSK